jgi:site-specific DNA-cytosine methylase
LDGFGIKGVILIVFLQENINARGTLFYEFARVVKEVQPKVAIGENVKGLLTHDNGRTLRT